MLDWTVACRVGLVLWLGGAGLLKLRDRTGFRRAVHHYRILPRGVGRLYAEGVPLAELVSSLFLLSGVAVGLGALLAGLLLASFAVAVATNLYRGRDLDCHCFGSRARMPIGPHTLAADLSLLLPAVALLTNAVRHGGLLASGWPIRGGSPTAGSFVIGLGYALAVGLIYLIWGSWHPVSSQTSSVRTARSWEE